MNLKLCKNYILYNHMIISVDSKGISQNSVSVSGKKEKQPTLCKLRMEGHMIKDI